MDHHGAGVNWLFIEKVIFGPMIFGAGIIL